MIDEIAETCDNTDNYLSNAEFVLNSKLALVWGGFVDDEGELLDYCFEERFKTTHQGKFVEITDLLKNVHRTLPYDSLKRPQFNLVH
jgi:hypothetical protein